MKPVVLCIMDGCGIRESSYGNAFLNANTPHFDDLWNRYPHSLLQASGRSVGLPQGQMGNSEVGHMNIGAGRLVYQPLELIHTSIEDGSFFQNTELLDVIQQVKSKNSKLHIMGLVSDGGVHSHIDHLMALLTMCEQNHVERVYLHLFTDGRDVPPTSAAVYLSQVENRLNELGIGKIATISGRYYAMDRDNNYDRLRLAYDAIVNGTGPRASSIQEFLNRNYQQGITDEFFIPTVLDENGTLEDNDGIFVFNFRKDRLRELFTAITNPEFHEMEVKRFQNLSVVTMLPVVHSVIAKHAFEDPRLTNILGEYISKCGLSQLRIAETEKYAHVTFFFDGGKEEDYPREKKVLIPSPKVATYDLQPKMSSVLLTDTLLKELDTEHYDLVVLNYANGDMVGHTGVYDAAVQAVEAVDVGLGRIYQKVKELDGILIVTADHGNCEEMLDESGNVLTAHTTNLVPFIVTQEGIDVENGKLGDIAPTILKLMGLEIPPEMTGNVLIK